MFSSVALIIISSFLLKDITEAEQVRKVFLGGLCPKTEEATLRNHFGKYGDMTDCCVIRTQERKSRCFGFVTFTKMSMVDEVMEDFKSQGGPVLDGKTIEIKRAIPRGVRILPHLFLVMMIITLHPPDGCRPQGYMLWCTKSSQFSNFNPICQTRDQICPVFFHFPKL